MRIAMIGQKGVPAQLGGIEQHVEVLARLLAARGHQVDVYCRRSYLGPEHSQDGKRPWSVRGVRRIFRWSTGTKSLDAITHTATCTLDTLQRNVDVVHYHALGPSSLCFVPRLAGRPVVATVHGLDWQRDKWDGLAKAYLKLGEWVAARAASQLVVVSKPLRDYFWHRHGRRTVFIPNGVRDLPEGDADALSRYGLRPGAFLLNVARLEPEKEQHTLIEAFQTALANRPRPDFRLVIAGGSGADASYEKRLRDMAGPNVVLTGPVTADVLVQLYRNAYMFALPSAIEGMSLALLEALSCGLPALVSDIPENTAVIEDGGFTFRMGDTADLVDRLQQLLALPQTVYQAGTAARRVAAAYQWPHVAGALEAVYEMAIRRPRPDYGSAPQPWQPAAHVAPRRAAAATTPPLPVPVDAPAPEPLVPVSQTEPV